MWRDADLADLANQELEVKSIEFHPTMTRFNSTRVEQQLKSGVINGSTPTREKIAHLMSLIP